MMILRFKNLYYFKLIPKWYIGIDQYQNIWFRWINRNEYLNGIDNIGLIRLDLFNILITLA